MHKYKSLQVGQLPQEHLSFLQNLLSFIITKYLKQEVDDELNVCVDECSPSGLYNWRYKDLSMSPDEKVRCSTPSGEVPCQLLLLSCFYCPNLITVAPL